MRYFYIIPAAVIVAGILVGHAQVERDVPSAPTPVAAVNPLGATSVMPSPPASVSSVAPEATGETGNGGGVGLFDVVVAPTPTAVVELVEEAGSEPQGLTTPQPATAEAATVVATALVAAPVDDLMAVIQATFPAYEWETAYRVAMCESGGDPNAPTGAAGEEGAWQVIAEYHGPVPSDLYGQAVQVAGIVVKHGWLPWSCY